MCVCAGLNESRRLITKIVHETNKRKRTHVCARVSVYVVFRMDHPHNSDPDKHLPGAIQYTINVYRRLMCHNYYIINETETHMNAAHQEMEDDGRSKMTRIASIREGTRAHHVYCHNFQS